MVHCALCAATIAAFSLTCGSSAPENRRENRAAAEVKPQLCRPIIVDTLPHATTNFTQGLSFHSGELYDSTGLYGKSSLQRMDSVATLLAKQRIADNLFAEGCCVHSDRIYQLTWREGLCLVWSLPQLQPVTTMKYGGEGWGITSDGNHIIMSNGSDTLYLRDDRFNIVKKVAVTNGTTPLVRLNELEYCKGHVFANVWYSDYKFEIDLVKGTVVRTIDCSELAASEGCSSDEMVLNGIAYDGERDLFYVTGKNWKHLYVLKLP